MKKFGLVVITAMLIVAAVIIYDRSNRRVLVSGDRPVTELQIREKLESEGYTNVQMTRSGGYFEISASKDGKAATLAVDADTGRLANEPFHDADEQ